MNGLVYRLSMHGLVYRLSMHGLVYRLLHAWTSIQAVSDVVKLV